jgi:hypothetical protein
MFYVQMQSHLAYCAAVVGKGVEHPFDGRRSFVRFGGGIKLVAVHRARADFIRILPNWRLSGAGSGLAFGGFGRRHHCCVSGRVLPCAAPGVVKFSKGNCFCCVGCARLSVSSVLAVETIDHKVAWDLTNSGIVMEGFTFNQDGCDWDRIFSGLLGEGISHRTSRTAHWFHIV